MINIKPLILSTQIYNNIYTKYTDTIQQTEKMSYKRSLYNNLSSEYKIYDNVEKKSTTILSFMKEINKN